MKPTTSYQPIPLPDFHELPLETMRANAEAFYAEMRARHTVREFSTRPVPRDIIETCILTAGTAPNGANHQPWHFAVIGDSAIKKRIREAAEIEERAFYEGRAGEEWLAALTPLGTDADKPFLKRLPGSSAFSASAAAAPPMACCARTTTCRNRFRSRPVF